MNDKQKLARIPQGALLLLTLVCVAGCSMGLPKMEMVLPVREAIVLRNYTAGETYQASPGEIVIEVGSAAKHQTFVPKAKHEIEVREDSDVSGFALQEIEIQLHLSPEQRWNVLYQTPGDNGIIIEHSSGGPSASEVKKGLLKVAKVQIHLVPEAEQNWRVGKGIIEKVHGVILTKLYMQPLQQEEWWKDVLFQRGEDEIHRGAFTAELIYLGISGDTLRIGYKEFINNAARPSFFQDLTFDLSRSQDIRFKDITMEIIEATNTIITFKVIGDEGLAWIPEQ